MISKVNLSTVTFSNEWRRILKSDNQNSKSFISIYLDLTEISNKSKDNFLFYNEHNDSVKNLLSVFNVSPDDPRMAELIPYKDAQSAIDDIKANAHSLDWFDKPENYKTYDELKEKLDWVYPPENASIVKEKRSVEPDVVSVPPFSADVTSAQVAQVAQAVPTATSQPEQKSSADALIDSLLHD